MKTADAIVEILKREGVEYVFCFPFTPILDALADGGIRPIVARQERVAENIADGMSRTSNGKKLGVVTVQQSAGAENAFAGIAQAYTDSSPLLFLPGHPGSQLVGMAPTFDSQVNYAAITKWSDMLPSGEAVDNRMRRAFTALRSGRPRPVMLEIPVDVAASPYEGEVDYQPVVPFRSAADPAEVKRAVELLSKAERPLIWAGQGVLYSEASEQLTRLAEQLGIPVTTTLMGKSGFNERHPLSLGTSGFSVTQLAADAVADADVVFALGASLARDFTAPPIPGKKTFIHNTVDTDDINRNFAAEVALIGDAKLVLEQLLAEVASHGESFAERRQKAEAVIASGRAAWQEQFAALMSSEETPINPYRVIGDFMKTFDPDTTIVTHESGNSRDQLVATYVATTPRSYLGWGHSTQLGFSLGCAMGAKLAEPDKMVANFMGDGAFGMVGMDLETAVREKIPIMTVLLNNSAMGNYEKNIPIASEKYGTKFLSGNYSKIADGLGAYSERITDPAQIIPAFERARARTEAGEAVLLEFITSEEGDIPYWYRYKNLMAS